LFGNLKVEVVLSADGAIPAANVPVTARVPAKGSLLRVLGVTFGIAVAIGGSVGAGIIRTPSEIANRLPSMPLIMAAWTLGAIYSLLGAWSLAEVAAMIPSAGAYYTIGRRAYGDYVGFVVGWEDWLSNCGATAAAGILVGEYGRDLVPGLSHPVLTGTLTIAAIAFLQWLGIRWGSQFQNVTSAITAVVFFALVAAAFLLPHATAAAHAGAGGAIPKGLPLIFAFVLVLQPVIYTFDGWYSAIYFGDEIRNPGREMPRSMVSVVILISAIYVLTNAALFHVLGVAGVAKENLPVAAMDAAIFGASGNLAVRILMVVTLIAVANCTTLCTTRVLFAMSRDGWGARWIVRVNKGGTPPVALWLSTAVAIAFLLSGGFEKVIAVTTFFYVAKYGMSYFAVFRLRRREPDTPRPYRAWGYPWTTGAAVVGSLAFLAGVVFGDMRNSAYAVLVLLASYPIYPMFQRKVRSS
jgi:APA family basic amino acid/polyamine antiporter